jgi:hypothetical protein
MDRVEDEDDQGQLGEDEGSFVFGSGDEVDEMWEEALARGGAQAEDKTRVNIVRLLTQGEVRLHDARCTSCN